ncbi:Hypothetical_protein [Hexamita inflata]|uniref:Hypothetical_protein n=1 Tax=Hexamita inflata TaxID=28002 RepID=A0AA86N6U9_9EUKA|nr:Hypothetical protein HINF_LOCUS1466 [Hexamita inflata]
MQKHVYQYQQLQYGMSFSPTQKFAKEVTRNTVREVQMPVVYLSAAIERRAASKSRYWYGAVGRSRSVQTDRFDFETQYKSQKHSHVKVFDYKTLDEIRRDSLKLPVLVKNELSRTK